MHPGRQRQELRRKDKNADLHDPFRGLLERQRRERRGWRHTRLAPQEEDGRDLSRRRDRVAQEAELRCERQHALEAQRTRRWQQRTPLLGPEWDDEQICSDRERNPGAADLLTERPDAGYVDGTNEQHEEERRNEPRPTVKPSSRIDRVAIHDAARSRSFKASKASICQAMGPARA